MPGVSLFIKMLRPQVAYILLTFAVLGALQGGFKNQLAWQYLVVIIVIASWYVNATTINDIADYEIDRINLQGAVGRPLANKEVSKSQIIRLNIISGIIALISSFWLDYRIGLIVAICLVLNYLYSATPAKISHRGALAPLTLPLGYVVLPFLTGVWAVKETITPKGWLILIALYISFVGRIILKDFRDVKGDAKFGKRTFILRYGRKATCIASAVGLTIGSIILLFIIPRNPVIILAFEVLWVCLLIGLYELYKASGRNKEQMMISSIVRTAGGIVIMLICFLILKNNGKSLFEQELTLGVLCILFISIFFDTLSRAKAIKT